MTARDFWNWFAVHAEQIEAAAESTTGPELGAVLADLDRRLGALDPGIGWEVGPHGDGWFLALSPKGSRDALTRTAQLVEAAPRVERWQFFSAKPPKAWDRKFQYGPYEIDARGWRYQLRRWDDGALGVVWGVTDEVDMDDQTMEGLGWFVLESEVGEELAIRSFADVEMTRLSEWADPESGGGIEVLQGHVLQLLQEDSSGGAA